MAIWGHKWMSAKPALFSLFNAQCITETSEYRRVVYNFYSTFFSLNKSYQYKKPNVVSNIACQIAGS